MKTKVGKSFNGNVNVKALQPGDALFAFKEYVASFQDGARQSHKGQQLLLRTEERRARAALKQAMRELKEKGILHATSSWQEIVPHLKDDPRFKAVLVYSFRAGRRDREPVDPIEYFLYLKDKDEAEMRHKRRRFVDILDVSLISLVSLYALWLLLNF